MNSEEWLNDLHIQAAHHLLKSKHSNQTGLQCTLSLQTKLEWKSKLHNFVQIISVGQHWVCASNTLAPPGVVDVFDSIRSYSDGSQCLRRQLAAILRAEEPHFHIRFVDVQAQSGGSDCGLFAIAFAEALCRGEDPHLLNLDQALMRCHLQKCFLGGNLVEFPQLRRRRRLGRNRLLAPKKVDVFCHCRLNWNRLGDPQGDLIQCDICRVWFHELCEKVDRETFAHRTSKWYCNKCFAF